jgi:hypothetical protein
MFGSFRGADLASVAPAATLEDRASQMLRTAVSVRRPPIERGAVVEMQDDHR